VYLEQKCTPGPPEMAEDAAFDDDAGTDAGAAARAGTAEATAEILIAEAEKTVRSATENGSNPQQRPKHRLPRAPRVKRADNPAATIAAVTTAGGETTAHPTPETGKTPDSNDPQRHHRRRRPNGGNFQPLR